MVDLKTTRDNHSLQALTITHELFARWIAYLDVKPKSIETYTKAVRQFMKWLQNNGINEPRREDILSYKRYLETYAKPSTIQNYIIGVRQFFKWLDQEGLYKNVADSIKGARIDRQYKRDYLTSNQTRAVLDSVEQQYEKGLRDYALILLMVTGGLRTIEISRANIEDLRTVGNNSVLFIQGKGKDEKTDYIKLPLPVEKAIRQYLLERGKQESSLPLFTSTSNNNKGQRMTTRSISGIVKAHLQSAGYNSDRLTAHSLRHTAATLNLLNGGSIEETKQLLKHAKIETTLIYAHHIERAKNMSEERITKAIFNEI